MCVLYIFCFKQKTAYELRISDWSSDVCSSDLVCGKRRLDRIKNVTKIPLRHSNCPLALSGRSCGPALQYRRLFPDCFGPTQNLPVKADPLEPRSEEHTSELQSLMRISYAVFCLKKKNKPTSNKKYLNN